MNLREFFEECKIIDEMILVEKKGLDNWDSASITKFEKTLGKKANEPGFFDACVAKMGKHLGDGVHGFCAKIKDKGVGNTKWRNSKKEGE